MIPNLKYIGQTVLIKIYCHNPTQLKSWVGLIFLRNHNHKPQNHKTEPSVTFTQLLDNQT